MVATRLEAAVNNKLNNNVAFYLTIQMLCFLRQLRFWLLNTSCRSPNPHLTSVGQTLDEHFQPSASEFDVNQATLRPRSPHGDARESDATSKCALFDPNNE